MRLRWRAAPAALLAGVLAAGLAGCGPAATGPASGPSPEAGSEAAGSEGSGTASPMDESPSMTGEESPASRPPVPATLDFTATTVAGERFEGASLAGRPVLLWFWAPWCPTCRGQVPQVRGIAEDHGDDLGVVGVGSLDSATAIAEFAGGVPGVTHLEDVDGALWRRFGISEQSSFVLLDADGEVVLETGYGGSEELGARVADVVG